MFKRIKNMFYKKDKICMKDIGSCKLFFNNYGILIDITDRTKFNIIRMINHPITGKKTHQLLLNSNDLYFSILGSKFPKITDKEKVFFECIKKPKTCILIFYNEDRKIEVNLKGSNISFIKSGCRIYKVRKR